MVPRIQWRKVGGVNIIEVHGVFAEPWVARGREQMGEMLEGHPARGLLANLREVEKVDRPGAEALLETVRREAKRGIWGHNLSVYFIAEHMDPREGIPIFERAGEAVGYFAREFAMGGAEQVEERRRFPRIETALPMEFELKEFGESFFFEAVVTNLSEGGLYGYLLDSETEELARRTLDPFDLKLLDIRLRFGEQETVEVQGKVLRSGKEPSGEAWGLALEFYNLSRVDEEKIRGFLKREGAQEKEDRS